MFIVHFTSFDLDFQTDKELNFDVETAIKVGTINFLNYFIPLIAFIIGNMACNMLIMELVGSTLGIGLNEVEWCSTRSMPVIYFAKWRTLG